MPKDNQEIPKAYRITLRLVAVLLFVLAVLFTVAATHGTGVDSTYAPGDRMSGTLVNWPGVTNREYRIAAFVGYFFSASLVLISWPQKKATKHGKR